MNTGKTFETDWKGSYTYTPYFHMRLKDGAKWVQSKESAFTPENPCDSIQLANSFLWLLELKSTGNSSMSYFPKTPYLKPKGTNKAVMIKPHQIKALMESVAYDNVIAGLVLNFRARQLKKGNTKNRCFFIHINDFIRFAKEHDKSSISIEDCEQIGIEIDNVIKRSRYKYNISKFVDDAIRLYIDRGYIDRLKIRLMLDYLEGMIKNV